MKEEMLTNADYLLFGCWTNGLFLFLQNPDKVWVKFAQKLPEIKTQKLALFTTFKARTGSMFKNMEKELKISNQTVATLKSRNGKVAESDKLILDNYINL